MPSPLTPLLLLSLLLVTPVAAAQTTLGEILDLGAAKVSADEFKRDVVQRTVVGTTPAGGTLEFMFGSTGVIAGFGTSQVGSTVRAPVNGDWAIDDQDRVCSSMLIGGSATSGGFVQSYNLPRRCQFWFKYQDIYFLSDSDSDRHARVLRRSLASAQPVIATDVPLTLPQSMKGNAYWQGAGMYRLGPGIPWSLAITKTDADGTFEGLITFVVQGCTAQAMPIANGVMQRGEVRFTAPLGAQCQLSFTLRKGTEHLLVGDADVNLPGGNRFPVWLDPSP